MKEHELLWSFLPEGLEGLFDVSEFKKDEESFKITLTERNIIPSELPEEYRGKKVTNTVLNDITINDFPIRGRMAALLLKRRSWKFEGIDKMLKRDINICSNGTKIEGEFADFLKELDRKRTN